MHNRAGLVVVRLVRIRDDVVKSPRPLDLLEDVHEPPNRFAVAGCLNIEAANQSIGFGSDGQLP